jgi:hypothetical protein
VIGRWAFFFFKGYPLGFLKKSFAAIEPKLLVMWEKVVDR